MYNKIGLALAFSPTCKALLAEATYLKRSYNASLILIHVGVKNAQKESFLDELLKSVGLSQTEVKIIWKQGKPAKAILKACKKEKVDLLIAGALKHESLISYYVGSVSRKILRRSTCSVLILTEPSVEQKDYKEIVIEVEDNTLTPEVIRNGLKIGEIKKASIFHLVRDLKLYGLAMSVISENSVSEHSEVRKKLVAQELKKVEKYLETLKLDQQRINIKILAGKSGFELREFAKKVNADLLVVGAFERRMVFFSRILKHNLEYIFENIPCNLLVVKKRNNPKP